MEGIGKVVGLRPEAQPPPAREGTAAAAEAARGGHRGNGRVEGREVVGHAIPHGTEVLDVEDFLGLVRERPEHPARLVALVAHLRGATRRAERGGDARRERRLRCRHRRSSSSRRGSRRSRGSSRGSSSSRRGRVRRGDGFGDLHGGRFLLHELIEAVLDHAHATCS